LKEVITGGYTKGMTEEEVHEHAERVFGNAEVATRWFLDKIPSLGYSQPRLLMGTPEGRRKVDTILSRIEHGVY
jgi:uncharacterized protein (DUF2384 family)